MLKTFTQLAGVALTMAAVSVQAQTASVSTVPEGVMTITLPATGAGQNSTSYISLPLTPDPIYTGAVSAVTANSISIADSPAPWTANALSSAAAPYFVTFLSGAEAGRTILVTANTTNSLTLDTTDHGSVLQKVDLTTNGFSVAVGDTFKVFSGDTLASVFGDGTTGNPVQLNGATSSFAADTVGIYIPSSFKVQGYYYDTNSKFWKASGSAVNANNTIIYPYSGFTVTRRANEAALPLMITGRVAEVALLTKTPGSAAVIYSSTQYATDMTLSQLNFGANWTTGSSPFADDTLAVWNAGQIRFDTYYQLADKTWRKSGAPATDVSSFVIPAGTTVAILKRGAVSGATAFLKSVLPYTL